MTRRAEDEEREERINMEIVVDANGPEEQAMGWYYYIADTMNFPFFLRQTESSSIRATPACRLDRENALR